MIFEVNEGKIDRLIRALLGLVILVIAVVVVGLAQIILAIIGIILIFTSITGFCLAYKIFGINTCTVPTENKNT